MAVFAYGFSKMYRQCLITKRVGNSIILDPIKRRVCYLVGKSLNLEYVFNKLLLENDKNNNLFSLKMIYT